MHDSAKSSDRQRGKAAIDAAHAGIAKEDEGKVSAVISDSYGVDSTEALDIHMNYHALRIISLIEKRARENGMGKDTFESILGGLDVSNVVYHVADRKSVV